MMINQIKNEKGITIPTLIITIIILLILAGITTSMFADSESIISQAKTAVKAYNKSEIEERIKLKISDLNIEKIASGEESATIDDILNLKNSDEEITDAYISDKGVVLVIDGYECTINSELEVSSVEVYNPAKLRKVQRMVTSCSFDK